MTDPIEDFVNLLTIKEVISIIHSYDKCMLQTNGWTVVEETLYNKYTRMFLEINQLQPTIVRQHEYQTMIFDACCRRLALYYINEKYEM